MLKLYYSPGACSFAPHIVLEEIGQPYEIQFVSTMDGSTRTDEYLKFNPKGHVPVLEAGKDVLTEAAAIMTYLALNYPEPQMLKNTPMGLARAIEWMNWLSGIHASIIAQNWRTERFSDDVLAHQDIQAKGMQNLFETYAQIESKLEGLNWAMGKHYSIIDPYLLVYYRWGNRLGLEMCQFGCWTIQAKKMEQRKAVKSVLNAEGISIWE